MKTTMKNFLQKLTKFKIQELKIVRENAKEIKIIKFSFLGVAIVSLLALGGYHYYNATKITPHNEVAIQYKAKLLLDHIKNNTVLKDVNYQYNVAALTAFQTNSFVDRSKAGLSSINFFTFVNEDKRPDSELFTHVRKIIQPKLSIGTDTDWEMLEEAELIKKFLMLEYYRCEIISIEDNFNIAVLTKYVDSVGNPILPPYHNQKEYDIVSEQWLKATTRLINDYNTQIGIVGNLFTQLEIAYKPGLTDKYYQDNSKKEIVILRSYFDRYFPILKKISSDVIGLDVPMAAN
jgi:hypothetical protein